MRSDGSVSNQGPRAIRLVPERTTTPRDASIDDNDSDEELGDLIWKSSRTATAAADTKNAADAKNVAALTATDRECERSTNHNQTSNSPSHSSVPN